MNPFSRIAPTTIATTCIANPFILIICDSVSVLLTKNYNPFMQSISELMLTKFGWIDRIGIIAVVISLGIMSLYLLKSKSGIKLKERLFAGVLLIITGLSFIMVVIFNTDMIGAPRTLHGEIHVVSTAIASIAFPIACILLAVAFKRVRDSQFFIWYSLFTALFGLVLGLSRIINADWLGMGLYERLVTLVNMLWISIIGFHFSVASRRIPETKDSFST